MDTNKLKKLKEIGYIIIECCGICEYATFKGNSDFGTCSAFTYQHKKHGDTRDLSIHRYGICNYENEFTQKLSGELKTFNDYFN